MMSRVLSVLALFCVAFSNVDAFSVQPTASSAVAPSTTRLFMSGDDMPPAPGGQRGVSIDQDGKSNVWAIEPKIVLEDKSSEDSMSSLLIAGGGIAGVAVAAGLILTNLPDPSQF